LSQDWVYYITWEDDEKEEYTAIREVDAMVAAAASGTDAPTGEDTYDSTMDLTATDAPTGEDTDEDTDAPTGEDTDESVFTDGEELEFEGGWVPATNMDDDSPQVPFAGIAAGVVVTLLVVILIRRRSTSTKRRRRQAELIAEEYKDDLELPEMD
jgi:hypothetical protein